MNEDSKARRSCPWGLRLTLVLALLVVPAWSLTLAQEAEVAEPAPEQRAQAPERQTFAYVLRLEPRLFADDAWTEREVGIVARHFAYLEKATEEGRVIMAGRTLDETDARFGIVVFEASGQEEARAFMTADPAIEAGIMEGTLHPFGIALQRSR